MYFRTVYAWPKIMVTNGSLTALCIARCSSLIIWAKKSFLISALVARSLEMLNVFDSSW